MQGNTLIIPLIKIIERNDQNVSKTGLTTVSAKIQSVKCKNVKYKCFVLNHCTQKQPNL